VGLDQRLKLHAKLTSIPGVVKAYFQPPQNTKLEAPCIVYKVDSADTLHAGNLPYRYAKRYEVTVIDRSPDSEIPDKIAALPMCTMSTAFVVDGLNHTVFNLYF